MMRLTFLSLLGYGKEKYKKHFETNTKRELRNLLVAVLYFGHRMIPPAKSVSPILILSRARFTLGV